MIGQIILFAVLFLLLSLIVYAEIFRHAVEKKYPPQGKFITVEHTKLHFVEKGQGKAVVLLHGDSGSAYDFTMSPLLDQLTQKYHVIAFDRPGLGYSERPRKDGWSPITQARLIRGAIKQLGIEKPVVVGHSRGGALLFAWALNYPADIAAAVGLAPAAFPGGVHIYRLLDVPWLGDLLYYLLIFPFEKFGITNITRKSLTIAFAPDRPVPSEFADAFLSLWLRRKHAKAAMSDIGFADEHRDRLAARYGEIQVPFVLVNGIGDHNVPPQWAKRLAGLISNSTTMLLPNTGHELMFNRPQEVASAVDMAWQMADVSQNRSEKIWSAEASKSRLVDFR